jgi:hypothetical protein
MNIFISFVVGFIFALALGFSGMTQVHNVRGFLDVFGQWSPNLIGVMAGAIMVHAFAYYFIRRRKTPLLDVKFHVPTRKDIDKRLLIGAALFGIGWGWAGICPGPGIVAATSGDSNILIFVGSMFLGMLIFKGVEKRLP